LELSQLMLTRQYSEVKVEYELLQNDLENEHSIQSAFSLPYQFEYKGEHTLS
jgi:hypothetical protein